MRRPGRWRVFGTRPTHGRDAFEAGWSRSTFVSGLGMLAALAALVGCGLAVMLGGLGAGRSHEEPSDGAWRLEEPSTTPGVVYSADHGGTGDLGFESLEPGPSWCPRRGEWGRSGCRPVSRRRRPARWGSWWRWTAWPSNPRRCRRRRPWFAAGRHQGALIPISGSLATAVSGLLSAVPSSQGDLAVSIDLEPTLGLLRETALPGHVEPCVVFVLSVSLSTSTDEAGLGPQQIAISDCQRLVWRADRWVLAPGGEPPGPHLRSGRVLARRLKLGTTCWSSREARSVAVAEGRFAAAHRGVGRPEPHR